MQQDKKHIGPKNRRLAANETAASDYERAFVPGVEEVDKALKPVAFEDCRLINLGLHTLDSEIQGVIEVYPNQRPTFSQNCKCVRRLHVCLHTNRSMCEHYMQTEDGIKILTWWRWRPALLENRPL